MILYSFENEVFLPLFHNFTTQRREISNSFADWKRSKLHIFLFNNNLEAANEIFFSSLCSQKPLILYQAGCSHENVHPIYSFSDSKLRDENGLVMGVAIKLIITEFATVNTIMDCLFKSNIHWISSKINDVFYIPFSPDALREHFWTTAVLLAFLGTPAGMVTPSTLRSHWAQPNI